MHENSLEMQWPYLIVKEQNMEKGKQLSAQRRFQTTHQTAT